jgi:hypothetical protein
MKLLGDRIAQEIARIADIERMGYEYTAMKPPSAVLLFQNEYHSAVERTRHGFLLQRRAKLC